LAIAGGADARADDLDRCHHVHDEPIALAPFAELFNIALGAAAEVKVGTDDDAPDVARPLHSIHELVCGEPRESIVELEDHDRIRSGFAQQLYSIADIGKSRGRRAGREHLDGERVERRRDRSCAGLCRPTSELTYECAVSEMHAVEYADRQMDRPLRPRAQVI